MNRIFLLFASFLLFSPSNSQNLENSLLWKISGNGLAQPSYLFGTIHAVPADSFKFSDALKTRILETSALVLEADVDIPLKEQINLAKRMFLPQGKSLKNYMDSALYITYYSYLKDSLHISESKINRYFSAKPIMLSSLVLMEVIGKPATYEVELQKFAKKKKKEFIGLETLEEQLNIIDSIPIDQQLPSNIEDLKIDKKYYELYYYYRNQNLNALDSLMQHDKDFLKIENLLLVRRNNRWIPKIESIIATKPAFIAVGCAHLVSENGLLNQLREKGYTVEPVYFKY